MGGEAVVRGMWAGFLFSYLCHHLLTLLPFQLLASLFFSIHTRYIVVFRGLDGGIFVGIHSSTGTRTSTFIPA